MSDGGLLTEMAFTPALAEQKVRGREETINEHLVKLLAFEASDELRESWKRELIRKHFGILPRIRLKPDRRRLNARDVFAWLYADPFEGNEAGYVEAMVLLNSDQYARNGVDDAAIAAKLRDFHASMADRVAAGEPGGELIAAL